MGPYFARQPVTVALFASTVAAWVALELRQSRRRRRGATARDRGSYVVLVACVAAGWLVTALYATEVPRAAIGGPPIAFVLGLVAAWSGIALGWSAFHVLGELFTFHVTTSADQPVIDSGPYRVLRHPGYTGIALVLIGMGLLYGNWIGVAAMAVLPTLGLVHRIHIEERALEHDLGDAYRTYAAGRKRMIPWGW
jgi:protein-S-isoprenylcysteine O-methyltransferase Ste14